MIISMVARYPVANVPYRRVYSVPVTKLVIHHLDFGDLPKDATQADELLVMDAVYAFHVNTRRWGGMGYHVIAFRSGRMYITANWNRWGAHTYMENDDSRGFAIAGDWLNAVPPESLRRSVAQAVARHDKVYRTTANLYGHKDFTQTSCPGNRYKEWVPQLRSLTEEVDDMTISELASALRAIQRKMGRGDPLEADEKELFDNFVLLMPHVLPAYIEKVLGNVRGRKGQRDAWAKMVAHPHPATGGSTLKEILDGLAARMQS